MLPYDGEPENDANTKLNCIVVLHIFTLNISPKRCKYVLTVTQILAVDCSTMEH